MLKSFIKLSAFTLAETLIVMGIIGVVAALTLPNLNSSTGDKEKVAKVKKIYQNLNDALGRAEAVYGPIDEWFVKNTSCTGSIGSAANSSCHKKLGERITEFMKISKSCETNTGCFHNGYKKRDGSADGNLDTLSAYKYILADGTSLYLSADKYSGTSWFNGETTLRAVINIDIDGPNKGASTSGVDYFQFVLTDNGILPNGTANSNISSLFPVWQLIGL